MASFWEKLFGANTPQVEVLEKQVSDNNEILEELKKEALSYEINPYDIANSEMMQSVYDSAGKEYYLEILESGRVGYSTLENMAKHPLVSSIVQTRVNQAAEFAQFSNDDDLGFMIKLRDDREEPNEDDIRRADEIKRFIQDCGKETIDFELTFESFIRQIVRDSLVYDQACFEVVRNRKGEVTGFLPVDGATIRRTKLTKEEKRKGRRDPEKPAFCQVIEGKVVAEFGQKDLCFGIRRPRTALKVKKYGYPELEELLYVLRNIESAEIFNASNFNNGISANGIIAVKSKMDPKMFRVFRREFYQLLTGVNNAKRTPLIQLDPDGGEDINSINLTNSNKEMEYNAWVSYLIKELCAVYQMDPAEIGFVFGSEGQSSSLIQADPATRVIMGKEKGLRPLIRSLQSWINKYIVYQIDPRFELVFVGLDSLSAEAKIDIENQRMKYMTVNEIRAVHDLEEIEDGDIIAAHYGMLKAKELARDSAVVSAQIKADASIESAEAKAEAASKSIDDDDDLSKKKRTKLTDKEKKEREKEKERRAKLDKPVYKPLPGDDKVKTKPSKYTKTELAEKVREEMKKPGKDEFIRAASKVSGVSKKIIEEVYDRGLAAWSGSHRPGATAQQWAKARVYSFLTGGKTQSTADKDLWDKHKESKKSLEKKFDIRKEECIRSDGTKGKYVLEMETESGEIREFCHFDIKSAQRHIGIIESASNVADKNSEVFEELAKAKTYIAPKEVSEEAKRGLLAIEEHGSKAGTAVGRTRARQLADRKPLSYETIKRMKAFFDRHEKNKDIAEGKEWYEDNGRVSWLLWGGSAGRAWAEKIIAEAEKEKDNK